MTAQAIIGRAEKIGIKDHAYRAVPAKVDTGADISSIWASEIMEKNGQLFFKLFARGSEYYTGNVLVLDKADYRLTRVASSFGHKEIRYVVKLSVRIMGRNMRVSFTLADRSTRTYPVLLGRKMLSNKFLVDVSKGDPMLDEEQEKKRKLRIALAGKQG